MRGVIGLDIGGVNTKAVWRDGDALRTVLRPYDVVRDREALTAVVRDVVAELAGEPAELVALTMTAELADEFRTKREGVGFVLDAVEAAVAGPVLAFTTAGELVSLAEARARPLDVAAANWVASALAVGALHPDALMLDVGSTTADVIPIAAGRVAAARSQRPRPAPGGRARLHRRAAHQPRDDRAARPGPRALVPGRLRAVRDQRRRAPDPRASGARGLHVPDAGRAGGERRVRARARRAARLRRRRAARARRDRGDRRVPPRRAGAPDRGGGAAGEHALRGRARRSWRSASGRSSPARWRSASAAPCSSCRGARRSATRRPRRRSPSSRPARVRASC